MSSTASSGAKILGLIIAFVALVAALCAASYYGGLFGNHVQASYDKAVLNSKVTQQVFNPGNKIQSQGYFEALANDFNGYLVKIQIAKQTATSAYDKVNLNGLEQECVNTAEEYNAASSSISSEAFRSDDLPWKLDAAKCAA